ncbi:LOW QUALITY PROTEIN: hypothetical protein HID58_082112, partial [Brassica napus]
VMGAIVRFRKWESSSDSGSQLISQHRLDHEIQTLSDDCAHMKICFLIQFKLREFDYITRLWEPSSDSESQLISQHRLDHEIQTLSDDCAHKKICFLIQFS